MGEHGLLARAVLKQAKTEVVLSHVSGLGEYDVPVWGIDLTDVHVTRVDGKVGRHEAGVHQHCGRIQEGDVVTRNGIQVMSATRLALEVTTVVDVERGSVRGQLPAARGSHHHEQLRARYRTMECWPNTLATDIVLRLSDPRIESVAESRSPPVLALRPSAPELQHEVRDVDGELIGRLDFVWPALGVWIEFDGNVKSQKPLKPGQSASDVVVAEKRREDRIRRRTGWRCIRLTWADLEHPSGLPRCLRRELLGQI